MRVRYTETASADLGDILTYLIDRNPRAAATVGKAIEATVARIAAFPASAQATDEPTVRMRRMRCGLSACCTAPG